MPMWGRMLGRTGRSPHYDRGIKLFDQGQYEQAINAFKLTLTEAKAGALVERLARFYLAESYSALAQSQMNHQADGSAIVNLKAAIELSPHYADLHFKLGMAYLNAGDPSSAIPPLEQALQINAAYARARLYLGIALYELGQIDAAFAHVEQATNLDASMNRELIVEARKRHAAGEKATALSTLRKLGETEGNEAMFHARLALDLFRRGMLEEAVEEYRQALSIAPNYADLRNQLGVTLFASRRDEEAVVEFQRALSINPNYLEARLNHALVLQRLHRLDEAGAEFDRVLEIDPENQVALEASQHLVVSSAKSH